MSMDLKGVVINYRRGPRTQRSRECLIQFPNIKSRSEASKLIGRKIAWSDGKGSTIVGVILSPMGTRELSERASEEACLDKHWEAQFEL